MRHTRPRRTTAAQSSHRRRCRLPHPEHRGNARERAKDQRERAITDAAVASQPGRRECRKASSTVRGSPRRLRPSRRRSTMTMDYVRDFFIHRCSSALLRAVASSCRTAATVPSVTITHLLTESPRVGGQRSTRTAIELPTHVNERWTHPLRFNLEIRPPDAFRIEWCDWCPGRNDAGVQRCSTRATAPSSTGT